MRALESRSVRPRFHERFIASTAHAMNLLASWKVWFVLVAVPLIGNGFDYLENLLEYRALGAFPGRVTSARHGLGG
ncbi:MAG: hypothetical protein P8J30_07515 [Ilumatobacter sp.]|nr:hypothetical protein [Ilumatobacter sp.]